MTEVLRTESVLVDTARATIYAPFVLAQVPRFLGKIDREPASRTYGSFDRENWAWKFRDFPIGVLQWAGMLPLAWLWRLDLPDNRYRDSHELLVWTRAALDELLRRQHRNGAFDSVGPNTQDYGASLAACYYLAATARTLGSALPEHDQARVRAAMARAIAFAPNATEDYAYISNHHALFALGVLAASEYCDEPRWRAQADSIVADIIAHQSPDGFYAEYGGNDPGYESLGIDFLARIWVRTRDATLLASLRRAVAYYAYAPQLDGSLGGALGSRHTRLWFPGGFEQLASVIPEAAAVAAFMRARLQRAEVVTPETVDAQNLPVMLGSYLTACQANDTPRPPQPLPCETLRGHTAFSQGMHASGTDQYYAVAALHKGGLMRVVERARQQLVYEDAGWIARSEGRTYASQLLGLSEFQTAAGGAVSIRARFGLVRQEQLTPWRFVLLRLLNLTVFRSLLLGNLVRRLLIARLITSAVPGPIVLTRHIRFSDSRIDVHDALRLTEPLRIDMLELARSFTGIHMGSAKYFHPSDALSLVAPSTAGLAQRLTREQQCELRYTILFDADTVSIVADPSRGDA
ncbi:MAG TPA: hypothetical protein VJ717_11650 [Gemmatimonadaceae bacterium]|nr:hypothetical protein [Gemmatimonadaceae bacterium]